MKFKPYQIVTTISTPEHDALVQELKKKGGHNSSGELLAKAMAVYEMWLDGLLVEKEAE